MNRSGIQKPDSRLPRWTRALIVLGGLVSYLGVGQLLEGVRFQADLETLLRNPADLVSGGPERIARLVLLLVPAVLGALWTRDTLRIIFKGVRQGHAPAAILKDVALFALSFVVLILVGLTTSSRPQYP